MRPPVRGRLRILIVNIAGVVVLLFCLVLVVYGVYQVLHGGPECSTHHPRGCIRLRLAGRGVAQLVAS